MMNPKLRSPRIMRYSILAVLVGFALTAQSADPPLVFPIREGDLHGLIDRDGKVIQPAEFAEPLHLSDA